MMKLFRMIDRKAGEMSQERFNTYVYIFIIVFIIIPLFISGFNRWLSIV